MLYGSNSQEDDGDNEEEWLSVREGVISESKPVWELRIYRLAHALGVAAHHLSLQLPKYELYESGSQLRRASKSVSANIVEGYGRRQYRAEYLRFLVFAKASLSETEEHLHYVADCHPAQASQAASLLEAADQLGRKLHRFMLALEAHPGS